MPLVLFELFSLLLLETALLLRFLLGAALLLTLGFQLLALRGKRLHGFCADPCAAQLLLHLDRKSVV